MARIYIVDDQLLLREGLKVLLQSAGHEVVGESSVAEGAAQKARSCHATLVLLDLGLGQHSGFDLLQELNGPEWPISAIVLTASTHPRHVAQSIRLSASGYVLKDAGAGELLRAIDRVTDGHRFYSQEVADLALQALRGDAPLYPYERLSPRERQVVTMVVDGMSSAAIGTELHLSPKTVETYRSRIMEKLGVSGVASLVRLAVREQWVPEDRMVTVPGKELSFA